MSGIVSSEAPVDSGSGIIALGLKCAYLPPQLYFIRYSTPQTMLAEDAQFYLRHIQPTPVLGCVVELQSPRCASCLGWLKGFIERPHLVGMGIACGSFQRSAVPCRSVCRKPVAIVRFVFPGNVVE